MKIALIGATGYTGSPLLAEALQRGHDVTALVRHVDMIETRPRLAVLAVDVIETNDLAAAIEGHDVVISAFNPGKDATGRGAASIIAAVKAARVPRLLVVGGAGSLEIAPGKQLIDQPDFPAEWKDGAAKTAAFLDALKREARLDWTFVSPPAHLEPGARTGSYRVGTDALLVGTDGKSCISTADLAVALLDEAEQPRHSRKRFTVAY